MLFPRRFALLVSDDPADVANVLEELKVLDRTWGIIKDSRHSFWERVVRRSTLGWTWCKDVMERLRRVNFNMVPDDVRQFISETSSNFNATAVTEDSFHYVKATARKRPDEHIGSVGMWRALVNNRLLSSLYKFREVLEGDVPEPAPGATVPAATSI